MRLKEAQIASLALWLRAQRAWHQAGVKAKDRPQVGRGHVVAAVAPSGGQQLLCKIIAQMGDCEDVNGTWQALRQVSETGAVLVRPDGHVAWRVAQVPGDPREALANAWMRCTSTAAS